MRKLLATIGILGLVGFGVYSQFFSSVPFAGATTYQVWQGGTGFSTAANGVLVMGSGTNVLTKLATGSAGQVLTMTAGLPAWAAAAAGGGGGAAIGLREGFSAAFVNKTSISFDAGAFNLSTANPDARLSLDYTNGPASRAMSNTWTALNTFNASPLALQVSGNASISANLEIGQNASMSSGYINNYLDFNVNTVMPAAPAAGDVRLHAFDTHGISRLMLMDESGFSPTILRDNVYVAHNTSGAPMTKGQAVYVTGSTGNVPNIALAQANSLSTLPNVGILAENIGNNAYGNVMIQGILDSFDTSGLSANQQVYVSSTIAGGLTTTRPAYPNFPQGIGEVLVSGIGNGSVLVHVAATVGNREAGTNSTTYTFAGSASVSTNFEAVGYASASHYYSGGLTSCTGQTALQWTGGLFSCSGSFQTQDATLTALAALDSSTGFLGMTGADTFVKRTMTGTTNQIAITNGDSQTGNPVWSITTPFIIPGRASVSGNFEILGTASVSSNFTVQGTGSSSFAGSLNSLLGVHSTGNHTTLAQFISTGVGSNSFSGSLNLSKGLVANRYGGGGLAGCVANGNVIRWNAGSFSCATLGTADIPDLSGTYLPLTGGTLTGNLIGTSASLSANLEVVGYASVSKMFGSALTDCSNATTSKLLWTASTGKFTCGVDQNSGTGGGSFNGIGVREGTAAFSHITSLSFVANGFNLTNTASLSTINLDYTNGPASRTMDQTISGIWSFTNAITIPNSATGPTLTTGQIGINTGSSSLNFSDGATKVLKSKVCFGVNEPLPAAKDQFTIWNAYDPFTISEVYMRASGSNAVGWNLRTGSGGATNIFTNSHSASGSATTKLTNMATTAISDGFVIDLQITSASQNIDSLFLRVCGTYQ